jgi:nucleoside 2-deoxyribosyltransferase
MKIYLAGRIKSPGKRDDDDAWRQELIQKFPNIDFVNPLDIEIKGMTDEQIVKVDKQHILECNVVIANLSIGLSIGTIMEIMFAHQHHIEVWSIQNIWKPSPWLTHHSTYIYRSIEQMLDIQEARLNNES